MVARRRKLRSFESLEKRYTFAGDVTASVDGSGNLLILGDSLSNGIKLTETSTGQFDLVGTTLGNAATKINSVSNGTLHLTDVTGKITIRGGEGNDIIDLPYFNYGGSIVINTGNGSDTVRLGDGNASCYLVGGLSIRTNEGTKSIGLHTVNVLSYFDIAARETGGGTPTVGKRQDMSVVNSNFGSLFYVELGARPTDLIVSIVNVTGEAFIGNGRTYFNANDYLSRVQLNGLSVGENLQFMARGRTSASVSGITVNESFSYSAGKATSTHNLNTFGATVGNMTVDLIGSYDYQDLRMVRVDGDFTVKSHGTILVSESNATNASFNSQENANSYIGVQEGTFGNLKVQSGDPLKPAPAFEATIKIGILATTVYQTLTISPEGRLKTGNIPGPEGGTTKIDYNPSPALIQIVSSTIGTLSMPRAGFEPDIQQGFSAFGPAGPIDFRILSTIIQTVNIRLPRSDDELILGNVLVQQSTTLDGGGFYPASSPYSEQIGTGRNVLTVNGSSLPNLMQTNFIFVQNP